MWYIHTMESHIIHNGIISAIKRDEIGSFVMVWMDLDSIV